MEVRNVDSQDLFRNRLFRDRVHAVVSFRLVSRRTRSFDPACAEPLARPKPSPVTPQESGQHHAAGARHRDPAFGFLVRRGPDPRQGGTLMWDVIFILLTVLFFAISIAYTHFCD